YAVFCLKKKTGSDEKPERDRKRKAYPAVQSGAESEPPYGAEKSFPPQRIMILAASCPLELDGDCKAGRDSRSHSKEKCQPKAIANSDIDVLGHNSGEQPQRTVLPSQQIIGEIQAAEHIQTDSGQAGGRNQVVIHPVIIGTVPR